MHPVFPSSWYACNGYLASSSPPASSYFVQIHDILAEQELRACLFLAMLLHFQVSESISPGQKRPRRIILVESPIQRQTCLLQNIPRIRLASHQAENVTKERLLMLGQQQHKLFGGWGRLRTHSCITVESAPSASFSERAEGITAVQGVQVFLSRRNSIAPAFSPSEPPESPPRPKESSCTATHGAIAVIGVSSKVAVIVSPLNPNLTRCHSPMASGCACLNSSTDSPLLGDARTRI